MDIPPGAFCAGIILLLVYLCNTSDVFKYYTKFAVFIFLSLVSATIFMPLMIFNIGDYRNGLLPAWGARQASRLLGLKVEMKGKKNIVGETGCVILINHQSCLDLQILAEIWPVMSRSTVIAKREVFYLWPFGLAAWMWGTVFIDRINGPRAQSTINKTAETINTRKARICMFPEGTRHAGNELLPFKKGAFHIAIASQVPIQPVVVSQYKFLDSKKFIFNKGDITINILPAIETKGLKKDDIEDLIKKTHKIMNDEFKKVSGLS